MATAPDSAGKPLMQEVATIERDVTRTFFGNKLTNDDDTLATRGGAKGLKIYEELKRDCHAGAVLGKRKLAVTSRPWDLKPASEAAEDVAAAELVRSALDYLRFNGICKRLLDAVLKGYAVAEVIWELRDGKVLPKAVKARDARRFVFDKQTQLRMLTREQPSDGIELPDRKFIVHRHDGDDDHPYGLGVGSMLFWPVFFKRNGISFWLTFADKFGSPTALGKYPNGSDPKEQAKLLQALGAIAQDAGVIVPEGMVIELLEAARSGSVDTYEKLVRYMDEQMSKAVLGETMSTTAAATGLGSNQASVHNEVRLELAQDDADELCETLDSTLVRWIVEFNSPGAGLPRLKRNFEEPEDLEARSRRDKNLFDMGLEPDEDYIVETYGEGWHRKAPAAPVDPLTGVPLANPLPAGRSPGTGPGNTAGDPADDEGDDAEFAEGRPLQGATAQRAFNAARQQAIVDASEQLAGQWKTLVGKRVEDLMSMLDETGDLVQFRERMGQLVEAAPDAAAVEAIARATFAGHVMGRGPAPAPVRRSIKDKLLALVTRRKGGA